MYSVRRTKKFEKSFEKVSKGVVKSDLKKEVAMVIDILSSGGKLPVKYRDHKLKGQLADYRECHIRPDILLIYEIKDDILVLF